MLFRTGFLIVSCSITTQGYMLDLLWDVTSTVSSHQLSGGVCYLTISMHNLCASYGPWHGRWMFSTYTALAYIFNNIQLKFGTPVRFIVYLFHRPLIEFRNFNAFRQKWLLQFVVTVLHIIIPS